MDDYVARAGVTVRETVDARKERYGRERLPEVWRGVSRVVVARRGKRLEFDPKARGARADLEKAVLGPSGNLRAPAARVGDTLLVGFDEAVWDEILS